MTPDFQRPLHVILGLPFDAIDEAHAEAALRQAVARGRRCFLSTPNLNFAVACFDDASFRDAVLQSDLSIADGWPITAVARLLGASLDRRVTGSGLFERLRASAVRPPLKIFFYGGAPGVAEAACIALNAEAGGLSCVGHDAAGYGPIEQMSAAPALAHINASGADFVVVSLGAKKGQGWIRHNMAQLQAPLISHLGAVVNFVAGTVERAPRWVQRVNLEWAWRIAQEPALMRRYAKDGWALLQVLLFHVLPLALHMRWQAPQTPALSAAALDIDRSGETTVLRLRGAWTQANLTPLRNALQSLVAEGRAVLVDLSATSHLDTAALGLQTLLHGWHRANGMEGTVGAASKRVRRMLAWTQTSYLLRKL